MGIYTRKSYWLVEWIDKSGKKHKSVESDFCKEDSKRHTYDKFLGEWYPHEQTPYVNEEGKVVRLYYGKEVELL